MSPENLVADFIAIVASIVALVYVLGIWRVVHARSRMVLAAAMAYMVATRGVILIAEMIPGRGWIESHRSIIIMPQYVAFAVAFAMTYYELRRFHFDVPQDAESRDTEAKHVLRMEELRESTDVTEEENQ